MAFIKANRNTGTTLGRMYVITWEQFEDVLKQGKGVPVEGPQLFPSFESVVSEPECYINGVDRTRHTAYGRIVNLGERDGFPVLTFTAVGPENRIKAAAPSRPYLQTISRGLLETYPRITRRQIVEYFVDKDGMKLPE